MAICHGEMKMYNEPREQAKSFVQIRKEFVYRLSNFEMNRGQFTIVEDLPATRPLRTVSKIAKTGKPYNSCLVRISSGGFESDLELFGRELDKVALALPPGVVNYKGVTLYFDGAVWANLEQGVTPPQTPAGPQDQKDVYVDQLVQVMKANDSKNIGVNAGTMLNYCKSITNGDALELISYAKTKGAIYEQGGNYKAV